MPFLLFSMTAFIACKKDDIKAPPTQFNLDKFEQNIIDALDDKTVGFSYSISQNGRQVRKGAGGWAVASWDNVAGGKGIPHASTKRQDLASCSKTYTALTLMRLLQDKNLNEKALLIDYLPSFWDNPSPTISDMNFDMLMRHESGFLPGQLDYFSLKNRIEGGGIFLHGNYNYQNVNYAFLRVAIAYLSHKNDLKVLEDKFIKSPTDANEKALEAAINSYYIEQVNQKVFAPCGIPFTNPKPDGESNPTMNYNFDTQDPGWNKGDMTRFAGSAGWRLSSQEQNNIIAHLKYTEDILNDTWKKKMNDRRYGWSGVQNLKGGSAYYHGGYYEDKFSPNNSPDPKGRGCYTIHVLFGNNIEAAVQVNSLGGTNNMENTVIPAFNNAWTN
jgi:hypothetical protein